MIRNYFPLLLFFAIFASSCSAPTQQDESPEAIATVSVVVPDSAKIKNEISLNAVSTYLLKTDVKANINGYILRSNIHHIGDEVNRGQTIFVLQTKEAASIGNTINNLDPSFNFSGKNKIKSPVNGIVTTLNHQAGDFVQEGETLTSLTDRNSFGFLLNLPYEDHQLLLNNKNISVLLPDGTTLQGYVSKIMPQLDSITQTQQVLIKTSGNKIIPQNLIAKVVLLKSTSSNPCLPKSAVFSDETQQEFWVMKLLNDSTAVKMNIKKGLENNDFVEIDSPRILSTDQFVSQGGYGLADTAKISIQK